VEFKLGMYDEIRIYAKCPYCGKTVTNAQTKDLHRVLSSYNAIPYFDISKYKAFLNGKRTKNCFGDYIFNGTDTYFYPNLPVNGSLNVIVRCHSVSCKFDVARADIINQGCVSGFGRMFRATLPIIQGRILSELNNVELDGLDEDYFVSYKDKPEVKKKLGNLLMKNKNQEVLAVLNWVKD